ncbi:hypothetical protein KAU11_11835, partial [Candidatus Babeliales bacterium]|nr:hypothetical protein [Candidatus Babeliales bacterium]
MPIVISDSMVITASPDKNTFGRIPVTIIQIDQDLCCKKWKDTNTCGTCNTTEATECYNTFATCQSIPDYDLVNPLTLSFAKPQSDLPDEVYIIPSVKSISTSPGRINVGGRSGKDQPLGRRAQITVSFQDHPHSDNFTDPYLSSRTYDPLIQGTFWGKWLKRNPYHQGRALRLYEGYYGQTIAEMRVRHYVIDTITLPDSKGNVKLVAKDILTLADNKKAQAPTLSTGMLLTDITDTTTDIIVTSAIIGDYTSYPTDIIRIEEELIRYTGLYTNGDGNLVFTGLTRGSDNTIASSHDLEDTVQACLEYDITRPDLVAYDLITNYGNVLPTQIDIIGWNSEGGDWLATYTVTRIISEPTGVTELLGQLCEQALMYMWWDEYEALVKLRVLHPPLEVVPLITEEGNLLQNSVSIKTETDLVATEIWASYNPINPVNIKERKDFKTTTALIDAVLESSFALGVRKVYSIIASWIQSDAIITQLTSTLLYRYSSAPIFLTFTLDAKDND